MLIAREKERAKLRNALGANESQFIAVYGRRRIGKTYLIRESFDYSFTFQHAGVANGSLAEQLFSFASSLKDAGLTGFDRPTNWFEAFELLKDLIRSSSDGRKVVFFDELAWMDTPRSDLMRALETFWNGWASARRDIVLVVCASATSWMVDKVIHNKGGLYNRLTLQINLQPFSLGQCEEYLEISSIALTRHQIAECYMVLGGIPYYWSFIRRGLSLPQNIDAMFFAKDAPLKEEFEYLYASLYKDPSDHLAIVEALATRKVGMTRSELVQSTGVSNSGTLTRRLKELESCGFIRGYRPFGRKNNGTVFQLMDSFTFFYYKFLRQSPADEHLWSNLQGTGAMNAWCGFAFERVCLEHVPQMKTALGISGVTTEVCSWSCRADLERGIYGSQIDLIMARKDQVINICEMKYSATDYLVTKTEEEHLRRKLSDFATLTHTRSALHPVLVTMSGVVDNGYAGAYQAVITADDLFRQV